MGASPPFAKGLGDSVETIAWTNLAHCRARPGQISEYQLQRGCSGIEGAFPIGHLVMTLRPGFSPSPESYALAEAALGGLVKLMHEAGVTDQGDIDCIVAMTAGLMDAQVANDPTVDRWTRHLDRLVDLLVDDAH